PYGSAVHQTDCGGRQDLAHRDRAISRFTGRPGAHEDAVRGIWIREIAGKRDAGRGRTVCDTRYIQSWAALVEEVQGGMCNEISVHRTAEREVVESSVNAHEIRKAC